MATGVYRDLVREGRGDYYVTYQPADSRFETALISVVFPGEPPLCAVAATAMEHELKHWLTRFAVPAIAFSFDAKEDLVDLTQCREISCLTGIISESGEITSSWSKRPIHAPPDHSRLAVVYHELPTRLANAVKQKASAVAIAPRRGAALIVFLIVVVPLAIEIATLGSIGSAILFRYQHLSRRLQSNEDVRLAATF